MRKLIFVLGLLMSANSLFAQKTISGIITDKTGAVVSGASVKVKGTKKGVSSGGDGQFSIQVSANDILEISSIGYAPQDIAVPASGMLTVILVPSTSELTQVVFVGSRG